MNIAVAPHMPIIANGDNENQAFKSLSLLSLPKGVILYVPENWYEFLAECPGITKDYDLFSLLLSLPVEEVIPVKKAKYIKLDPDILSACDTTIQEIAKQQLYAIYLCRDAKRIYAGIDDQDDKFDLYSDKGIATIINFKPGGKTSLKDLIDSFAPQLDQLKHFQDGRKDGEKEVSPFSAYDKYNESYAKSLLKRAYEDHPGDISDKTYLYTYDSKYKTFVQFRPDRNNKYHGMDISIEAAQELCPYIVRLYHK